MKFLPSKLLCAAVLVALFSHGRAARPPAQEAQGRDPFTAPPALASRTTAQHPVVSLRAYGERADGEARALLELPDGSIRLVRRGDRLQLGAGADASVLEVAEIARGTVRLSPVTQGQELWVR